MSDASSHQPRKFDISTLFFLASPHHSCHHAPQTSFHSDCQAYNSHRTLSLPLHLSVSSRRARHVFRPCQPLALPPGTSTHLCNPPSPQLLRPIFVAPRGSECPSLGPAARVPVRVIPNVERDRPLPRASQHGLTFWGGNGAPTDAGPTLRAFCAAADGPAGNLTLALPRRFLSLGGSDASPPILRVMAPAWVPAALAVPSDPAGTEGRRRALQVSDPDGLRKAPGAKRMGGPPCAGGPCVREAKFSAQGKRCGPPRGPLLWSHVGTIALDVLPDVGAPEEKAPECAGSRRAARRVHTEKEIPLLLSRNN